MSLSLRTDIGCTEAVIDDDCGVTRFYEVANILSEDLKISFLRKSDEFDSLVWEFNYNKQALALRYNVYTGISIFPKRYQEARENENQAVVDVAGFLETKLMVNTARRYFS